jgi:hypothetical protein
MAIFSGRISLRKDGLSVSFFYRYRWGDQNNEYACGSWPRAAEQVKTAKVKALSVQDLTKAWLLMA